MIELDPDVANVLDSVFGYGEPCGSRVTCNPPPTNTDRDFLIHIPPSVAEGFSATLAGLGFDAESEVNYDAPNGIGFKSFRRGDLNLIVTTSDEFDSRHRAATHVCARLNLLDKQDRIAVFQAVLYGRKWVSK